MGRIRTISNAIKELKKDDPNCDLTYSALRKMVLKNQVPYAMSGTKYLVDVDIIKDAIFNNNNKEVVKNGIERI